QAVPVGDVQVFRAVACEEALVGRLDDVLGINLLLERGRATPAGEFDQLMGEALEEFTGRSVVPGLEAGPEVPQKGLVKGSGSPQKSLCQGSRESCSGAGCDPSRPLWVRVPTNCVRFLPRPRFLPV